MRAAAVVVLIGIAMSAGAADRAIKKSIVVDAPVAEVWKAWTTSEGIATFFSPNSVIELRPGGRYDILFSKAAPPGLRGAEGCQMLSYVPEKMISFSWSSPPSLPVMRLHKTFVVVELAPAGAGKTEVALTNGGYGDGPDWDKSYAYFDSAWTYVLNSLQQRFKEGPRKWPEEKPIAAVDKPLSERTLKEMAKFIGGTWAADLKGPEGPIRVEFTYSWHPDKKGIVGSGVIDKNGKHPVFVSNSFGIDPLSGEVYYLDSHNSGTVFFGHVTLDGDDLVFVFGPVGGQGDKFMSRGRFTDNDSYDNKIRQSDGKDIVGFTLKRVK